MADTTEKVVRDQLDEAFWVAHEELVAGTGQDVQLALASRKEGVGAHDFARAPRVHPVVLSVDE